MRLSVITLPMVGAMFALAACQAPAPTITISAAQIADCRAKADILGEVAMTSRNEGFGDIPQVSASARLLPDQISRANDCLNLAGAKNYAAAVNSNPSAFPDPLILPSGFPTTAADRQIWAGLSRAEKIRALRFLRNGATIRSSLVPDEQ